LLSWAALLCRLEDTDISLAEDRLAADDPEEEEEEDEEEEEEDSDRPSSILVTAVEASHAQYTLERITELRSYTQAISRYTHTHTHIAFIHAGWHA